MPEIFAVYSVRVGVTNAPLLTMGDEDVSVGGQYCGRQRQSGRPTLIRGRNDGTLIPQREGFNPASLLRRRRRNFTTSASLSYHMPCLCVAEPKVDPNPLSNARLCYGNVRILCGYCGSVNHSCSLGRASHLLYKICRAPLF